MCFMFAIPFLTSIWVPFPESLTRQLQDISAGLEGVNYASEPLEIELPFVPSYVDSGPLSPSSAAPGSWSTPLPPAPNAPSSSIITCASSQSAKSKTTLRRLSFTKCANVFSKLSLSPSRARSARDAICGRPPLGSRSRLEPIFSAVDSNSIGTGSAMDLPPPYRTHATNPGGAAAPVSPSRFATITSIEAVRAPDSPVPLFPSPKLSTESVFGSTQSLASLSETLSGPRCPRWSSIAGVPELKRKETMRSGRRDAIAYPMEQPVVRGT